MTGIPQNRRRKDSSAKRPLTPAARRALQEAEQRRKAQETGESAPEEEIGGRKGLDPVRYGDWEKDGTISDF